MAIWAHPHTKVSLIKDNKLKQTDRLMLIRLTDQLQGSDHLDISLEQMSSQMGIPRVTIQRSLKRLVQAGYLLQIYTRPPGKKRLLSINETKLKEIVGQSRNRRWQLLKELYRYIRPG